MKWTGNKVAAVAVIALLVGAIGVPWMLRQTNIPTEPTPPTPEPGSVAVIFRGYEPLWGGSYAGYGTEYFFDYAGGNWGSGAITTATAGSFTTGPTMTGMSYIQYFNGTSVIYPKSDYIYVPKVTMEMTGGQPNNYYQTIPNQLLYSIATGYADQLVDVTTGGLSGAIRTNSGNPSMANDTSITHNIPTTFVYTVSVTTAYGARLPTYINPAYPASGAVQGFAYFIFNSTNMYLQGSSTGSVLVRLASSSLLIVPIPMVIAGAYGGQQSASFTLVFPTTNHITVYGGTVWNTNMQQLQNAASTTFASLTAPTGYTVGSFQLLGNLNAGHTYALWNAA